MGRRIVKKSKPQFKFGRRSPKRAPSIRLSRILKSGAVPTHPVAIDYASKLLNWLMLGNDQYGDCVAVAWANITRLVTAFLSTEDYPTLDQVIAVYKTQNPNFPADDNGMDIQTLLEYLSKNPDPAGRNLIAFASVDFTNPDEVEAAVGIFGEVMLGCTVNQNNMDEFNSGQPWSYDPASPLLGGHAVLMGGYDSAMGYRFNTWAQETSMDLSFIKNQIQEAWVMIYPEHLGTKQFIDGIDMATLAADYKALTGKDFPVVPPPPVPNPPPTPTPPPAPTPGPGCIPGVIAAIVAFFKRIFG